MKKIIASVLLVCFLFVLTSCGNTDEAAIEADASAFYENVVFDKLETFTEITELELNSTIEDKNYETTFCYIDFEDPTSKITDYKNHLVEAGFKMTSGVNDKDIAFELNGHKLKISTQKGESGTSINITMPCDEATIAKRNESAYNELVKAIDEKNYKSAYEITNKFSSDDIQGYKDVQARRIFAMAMDAYKMQTYGRAIEYFNSYLEKQPEDNLGAKAYIQECNNKIQKFNGTYSGKSYSGLVSYYMIIKDGAVGFEFDNAKLNIPNSYKIGDPIYYMYDLRVNEYDDGTVSLDICDRYFAFDNIEYRYNLTLLDNGNILVNDFAWDMLKGYYNDTSAFAGEYKRVADAAPKK